MLVTITGGWTWWAMQASLEERLTTKAEAALERGDVDAAIDDLVRALEHRPDALAARRMLALALLARGDEANAFATLQEFTATEHTRETWAAFAYCLRSVGQNAVRAAEVYERILDGADAVTLSNLGYCEWQLGRFEDSRRHLRAALDLDPKFASARFNLLRLEVVESSRKQSPPDLALVDDLLNELPEAPNVFVEAATAYALAARVEPNEDEKARLTSVVLAHAERAVELGADRSQLLGLATILPLKQDERFLALQSAKPKRRVPPIVPLVNPARWRYQHEESDR